MSKQNCRFLAAMSAFYDVAKYQLNARDPDDFHQVCGTGLACKLLRVASAWSGDQPHAPVRYTVVRLLTWNRTSRICASTRTGVSENETNDNQVGTIVS